MENDDSDAGVDAVPGAADAADRERGHGDPLGSAPGELPNSDDRDLPSAGAGEVVPVEGDRRGPEEEVVDAELVESITAGVVGAIRATRSEEYSGLLPHPEHWDKFDASTQERILKMSEAFTTDESARRDRLVDAEIAEAPKGRLNALWIMILCLVGAGVSIFVFQNNVGGGIFLAVPIATVVRDFIRGRK